MTQKSLARRVFYSVWRGPFYIGPLSRPVSLGDALLKVLETAWRGMIILLAAVAVLALLAGSAGIWSSQIAPRLWPPPSSKVTIRVQHFSKGDIEFRGQRFKPGCDPEYPISVLIYNGSKTTLGSVSFTVAGVQPGHSSNLLVGPNDWFTDAVLQPGFSVSHCFKAEPSEGAKLDDLVYAASVTEALPLSQK